jgi:hypothetical protein
MRWSIGVGVGLLLIAWYTLASIQSNAELDYTIGYVALVQEALSQLETSYPQPTRRCTRPTSGGGIGFSIARVRSFPPSARGPSVTRGPRQVPWSHPRRNNGAARQC